MRFISKLFAKKVNPIEEIEEKAVFVKCGECSLSQERYPHAPFHYEVIDTSRILCESCYENATNLEYDKMRDEGANGYYSMYWRLLPRPKLDYSNEPQCSGFIVVHTRATDRVYFGPFKTREELGEWLDTVGYAYRVSGAVYPIMNPQGDPEDFWYIPNDMPLEETLKPKKDREYIP